MAAVVQQVIAAGDLAPMSGVIVSDGAGAMITPAPAWVNSADPVAVAAGTAVSVAGA